MAILFVLLATHSTDESPAGCILRPQDFVDLPSYPECIQYHRTNIQAVPSNAALCNHHDLHDPWSLSIEIGWSVEKIVAGAVAAEVSERDNNSHLFLVAQALLYVLILLTLAKACCFYLSNAKLILLMLAKVRFSLWLHLFDLIFPDSHF